MCLKRAIDGSTSFFGWSEHPLTEPLGGPGYEMIIFCLAFGWMKLSQCQDH